MNIKRILTRRKFLSRTAAGAMSVPYLIPRSVLAAPEKPGANDRIAVGFVGCGGRAGQLMDQLPSVGRIVAVADCEKSRAATAAAKLGIGPENVYQSHRPILDRKDVDAVFVATMDHARVLPSIEACRAGKDVYAEKPLTVCIAEGRALVNAVRKYKRIFQVGSQQRTMEMNQFACRLVREGGIGNLHTVLCVNYPGPARYTSLLRQPMPADFNWDLWQNQVEHRPYNSRLHRGWMGWRAYSGGEMTNWGAHGLDQIQWALGASHAGPLEL
ncbi:MAG: Gfo/Idh/MocA family oxidoreductase, partial [Planctomycetota bacterium]|nr:Gfo/Idh/MocA family oxidoreductase [Planctomycetota bacterium]